MRTLAIGDIHGCANALDSLLDAIAPAADDVVVTLGDYVNRGPDSKGVIDRLLQLSHRAHLVALRGNHEQMFMEARDGSELFQLFLNVGGHATMRSYSTSGDVGTLIDVPDEHWDFLDKTCVDWHENATHFFVHANAYPEIALADQPTFMLLWEPFNDPPPHESGKIMVCGHSFQKSGVPRNIGHAICIDTGAHSRTGWLTCFDTQSGQIWQANQAGILRKAWADEFLIEP